MPQFDDFVNKQISLLKEQDPAAAAPPPDPAAAAPPAGDMGAAPPPAGETEMDDESKKEADPVQYTKSVLEMITKVSPEMFDNYLDTFSTNFLKIKDKEQFRRYYATFYKELKHIFDIQDDLKDLFKQLQGDVEQLVSGDDTTPDQGKGGVGRPGPGTGPGV